MNTQKLNQENFNSIIDSSVKPVLVDFWAEGCGPCRMLAPVLDEMAAGLVGKAVHCAGKHRRVTRTGGAFRHHRRAHAHRLQERPARAYAEGHSVEARNLHGARRRSGKLTRPFGRHRCHARPFRGGRASFFSRVVRSTPGPRLISARNDSN